MDLKTMQRIAGRYRLVYIWFRVQGKCKQVTRLGLNHKAVAKQKDLKENCLIHGQALSEVTE